MRARKTSSRLALTTSNAASRAASGSRSASRLRTSAALPSVATLTVSRPASGCRARRPSPRQEKLVAGEIVAAQLQPLPADPSLELPRRAGGDDAPGIDQRQPVRQLVGLLQILRGQADGDAAGDEVADRLPERLAAARVQPGRRLVQEKHLGRADDAGGEVEPAPHAAGVGAHPPVPGIHELERVEQLARPAARVPPPEARQPGDQGQVLVAGSEVVERRELAGQADAAAHLVALADDVEPGDAGVPFVGDDQCRQHPHGRRLSRAVGPEEGEDAACRDSQIDPVDHSPAAVSLGETGGLDRVHLHVLVQSAYAVRVVAYVIRNRLGARQRICREGCEGDD